MPEDLREYVFNLYRQGVNERRANYKKEIQDLLDILRNKPGLSPRDSIRIKMQAKILMNQGQPANVITASLNAMAERLADSQGGI